MWSAVFGRRWLRWLLGVAVLILVGYGVYYQVAVAPELTGRRFGVELAGEDARLLVEVDEDASIVAMRGGVRGLSQLVATRESLFVLVSDVGADSDMTWVDVPLKDIDAWPRALEASRASDAFSIGIKDCRALQDDAVVLVSMMLASETYDAPSRLCGDAFRNTAEPGKYVTVDVKAVRPSELAAPPTESVVVLADVPNRDQVLATIRELLRPNSPASRTTRADLPIRSRRTCGILRS